MTLEKFSDQLNLKCQYDKEQKSITLVQQSKQNFLKKLFKIKIEEKKVGMINFFEIKENDVFIIEIIIFNNRRKSERLTEKFKGTELFLY